MFQYLACLLAFRTASALSGQSAFSTVPPPSLEYVDHPTPPLGSLWGAEAGAPFPTNSFMMNLGIDGGSGGSFPVNTLPYVVMAPTDDAAGLQVSYPTIVASEYSITSSIVNDLRYLHFLSFSNEIRPHRRLWMKARDKEPVFSFGIGV
jgi:endoglucanase Acf2